ncbi:hypothetical protein [Paenibacillus tianjinensis]|uniref:Uncharacterized protein n=1 Tax=Paenibacillus tianjinensis TaxID=2810347 RepID=A0ABX7LBT2_9BACL|nr:hypothetical protein [Paenibacillus tianjinensis]QSF43442.1 hypothetical protein JRJ22_19455 [Paenibacillus tianjinensis]
MKDLFEIIQTLKEGEVAEARLSENEYWYIRKNEDGSFVYCDEDGSRNSEVVRLDRVDVKAVYKILNRIIA